MRLRAGKRHGSGRAPSGASDSTTPASATWLQRRAWARGDTTSSPLPATANGEAGGGARVPQVEPAADDGNRRGGAVAGSENTEMGRAVDAEGEPGNDVHAVTRQVAAQVECDVAPVTRAAAAADDGDARSVEGVQ